MRWDKLRFVGDTNIDLPHVGADPAGRFVLKGADGLGAAPVDVAFARTANGRSIRQQKKPQNKQIVARVGLQPEWNAGQTSSDLREELYGLLTTPFDLPVFAQIMLGETVICQAQGDVSNLEASIFTKDPEVQVTLDTDDPYFLAPAIHYQFPIKAVVGGQTQFTVENDGTAPAGFWMATTFLTAKTSDLVISDISPSGQKMTISTDWAAGDTLIVDTRPGSRGVWKIASGQTAQPSILNDLSGDSTWLRLHKGDNVLKINHTSFDWYEDGFGHTPAYQGV